MCYEELSKINPNVKIYQKIADLNLTKREEIESLVSFCKEKHGFTQILVNNPVLESG